MKLIEKGLAATSLLAVALGTSASSQADAQASPSAYTTGYRYDAMHRLVGTISPDPDGAGPLKYAATRNTYDGAGRLTKVEKGELSTWQSETVAPSTWAATLFTVLQTTTIAYDSQSRKIQETLSGGGAVQTVTQYSYDAQGNLECTAIRMNPTGALPSSACVQTSPTPPDGPDQITRNVYDAADQLIQVRKGVGTSLDHAEATYSYTSTGKREYTIDGDGNTALFLYDGHDRQSEWVFPSKTAPTAFNDSSQATALNTQGSIDANDVEAYAYDLNGNRTSFRKRDGSTLNYTYDGLNRMTSKVVGANSPPPAADCSAVTFGIMSNGAVIEGAASGFTITKTGATTMNCSVSYATADSSAVAPGDYTAKSGTLTFTPTQTSQTVNVTTIDDTLAESSEGFFMNLTSASSGGALGNPANAFGEIDDNDSAAPPPPPADQPPTANPVSETQVECTTVTYDVINDAVPIDSDPDGDPLTVTAVTGRGFSVVSGDVQVTTLATTGGVSGTYTISDGRGGTATASLTVTVTSNGLGSCP